jgi:colanic acid/amylovoran biosynthesis protein
MKKVVITGVTGFRNRGVEALVTTISEQILKNQSDIEIHIQTDSSDYDAIRLPQKNIHFFQRLPNTLLKRGINRLSKFYLPLSPLYHHFQDASLLIATGGDVYTSDYPKTLDIYLPPIQLALHAKVPVMFLGQSISFKSDEMAQKWLTVAHSSRYISVREYISYNYLTKNLGLSPDKVKHTADPAFLLNPLSKDKVNNLLQSYGINSNLPLVAIAPSQGISRFAGEERDKHLQSWIKIVDLILNELNAQVIVIPHVQEIGAGNDDRILATDIHRNLNYDSRVHLISGDHTASEFKGLIASSEFLIAERMHAAIAGLSSSVCTFVVGYSVKAEGITTDMLDKEWIDKGIVIPFNQFLDADFAWQKIKYIWENRKMVSEKLQTVSPSIKQLAASNFDLIAEILK